MRGFRLGLLVVASVIANATPASAQPPADFTWNNFVSSGTQWSNANNWIPAGPPTSSIDRILWFGSSPLQNVAGYTTTNASGNFNVNAMVFNATSIASGGVTVTNTLGTDSIVFNTNSTNVLPSIWQTGTARVNFRHAVAGSFGITLAGGATGTTLQVLGDGVGDVYLDTGITSTGAGASGLLINQTGTRGFFTGSVVRLGGSNSNFTGGVTLNSGNLMLGNVLGTTGAFNGSTSVAATPINSLGNGGTLTINGGSLQFDQGAASSGTSPAGITGTLQVNNPILLSSTLNITGAPGSGTAPSGNIIGIFNGVISGAGGMNIAPSNGSNVYAVTAANTFSGAVTIQPLGNTVATLQAGTANVSTGSFLNVTSFSVTGNSSLTLNNVFGAQTRLNTVIPPSLTLNRGNFNLLGNPTNNVAETLGTLTANGMGSLSVYTGSATAQTSTLTIAGLNRGPDGRGTLAIQATNFGSGTGLGEGIVVFNSDPGGSAGGGGGPNTTTRSILPYAMGNGQPVFAGISGTLTPAGTTLNTLFATSGSSSILGLVRWDSATGRLAPLNPATEYAGNLYSAGTTAPTANQRYASTSALPLASSVAGMNNATTANSLVLDTNVLATSQIGVSVQGSGTLTVGGGAILVGLNGGAGGINLPSMINLGGLDFGSTTGYIHASSNLTINAPISGSAGVVKSQTGTLILNGNNSFTGGLTVNAGPVQFSNDSNLGAAGQPLTLNSGLTTALVFQPSNLFASASSPNLTVNRPITVGTSGAVVSVPLANNTLTLPGSITGGGQLFKLGAGTLRLTGDNSAFTGTYVSFAGISAFQNDAAIGAPAAGLVMAGGVFQPLTSFATNRDIQLTGNASLPAIYTAGQNLTINGNITAQNGTQSTLIKTGLGDLELTAADTFTGSFQNGFSSPTSVVYATTPNGVQTSGRTILSGANGAIAQASGVLSIANGEIVLDNSGTVNNNRIGSVTLSIIGGNVTIKGNATGSVNEVVGAVSFSNGNNPYGGILTLSTPAGSGQSTTLTSTATGLSANTAGGTIFVRGTNLGDTVGDRSAVIFGTTPVAVNGLVPSLVGAAGPNGATSEPTTFLGLSTITQALPNANQFSLVPFTTYTAGLGSLGLGAAANTYDITGVADFSAAANANALRMSPGGALTLAGTLTLAAGHVLSTGGTPTTITGGTLAFGANPARFTVTSGSDLTVTSATTGTAGLIKTGNGTLILNTASAITVTAGTSFFAVGQGTLRYGVANALPTTPNVFVNGGATLDINNTTSTVGNLNGYGNVNIGSGSLTVGSIAQIVSFGGALSGSGTFIQNGASICTLAGDSTAGFNGNVSVLGAGMTVLTAGALGTGTSPILLGNTSGTTQSVLTIGGAVQSFSRDITVQAGSTPTTPHTLATAGAGNTTISSNINMANNFRLTGTSGSGGGTVTMSGNLTESVAGRSLTVFSGNWSFTGNNSYTGGTTFDATTTAWMGAGSNSAFGTGPLTFTNLFGINLRADGGARTLSNNIVLVAAGGYFGVTGTNPLTLNGTVDLSSAASPQLLNITNTARTTFGGAIINSTNGFTKNGPGVLELKADSPAVSGAVTVNAGTLLVNNTSGSGTGAASVGVNAGAILGGNGTIGGPVSVNSGGILAPGESAGLLTLQNGVTFQPNSIFHAELTGLTAGTQYDQLAVSAGNVILGAGVANLNLAISGYSPAMSDVFVVINNTGPGTLSGTFAGLADQSVVASNVLGSGIDYLIWYGSYTGFSTSVVIAPVPEPATVLGICALGFGAANVIRRRFKKTTVAV